jgi:endo-1,3(4)-beta-glucanase
VSKCFDHYKLHSWAWGLTEFNDGRNQENTSEAVNAYYSAALIGVEYEDAELAAVGSTLTLLETLTAKMLNKIISVLWSNKRDSGLWLA